VTTQGFLSAIEKPLFATMMSVSVALVFPIVMLGALWTLGLDGIWLNFVGVNVLTAILAASLLMRVLREIRGKQAKESQAVEDTGMG
jgi:Na+-driven multidrug efflux pump